MESPGVTPTALPLAGTLVGGKYRLERYIAEGGMGVIASGRHVELDEPVALKFLKPDVIAADPTGMFASRFVREARATIKIKSEHVPRIFDVATLDSGVPYIVMELLSGEDLEHRLEREGPLPVATAIDAVLQALEALAAAHSLGMVHRDLKPANLFVSTRLDGSACTKVLDFGIAKLAEEQAPGRDHGLTGTHAVIGSPRYMAPEQMRATRDVDARADVWAIGTTLYELLAGTPPFDGVTLTQVCAAILEAEPPPFSQYRSDVAPSLEATVRRCLAKRPEGRFQNVADLAAALAPHGSPSAGEAAARVARVLGNVGSSSRLSGVDHSQFTTALSPRPSAPSVGGTDSSWSGSRSAPQTPRRGLLAIAAVVSVVALASVVIAVVSTWSRRAPNETLRATSLTTAPVPSNLAARPGAEPGEAPPPAWPEPAAPTESASPVAKSSPPPSIMKGAPKADADGPAPSASAPAKRPRATSKPSASAEGLWDDRK